MTVTKTCLYNNIDIHYRVTGSGPAVVLLHGFGEDFSIWDSQVRYLKEHYRLLVPDIPGSGETKILPASTADGVIIDRYAAVVKAMLDAEAVEYCTMIGHSMGGYITLAFAAYYPERLNAIGLFHSTAFADSAERIFMRKKGIEFILKNGAETFLRQAIPNLFALQFSRSHPEKIDSLIQKADRFSAAALVQYYEAMIQRPERIGDLKKYRKPVLFIAGEDDKSVYLQDSLKQFHLPEIAVIKIFNNVAHMGMWEAEDEANKTLGDFLNYVIDG